MSEVIGKRVLVCGGRDFTNRDFVWNTLSDLDATRGPFAVVIHGCATGVDSEAALVAEMLAEIKREPRTKALGFRADWQKYGKAAGPIRNCRMLVEGKPDFVIAFPGGKGTANLVKKARSMRIEVIEVKP
jgi:hypothetical protein